MIRNGSSSLFDADRVVGCYVSSGELFLIRHQLPPLVIHRPASAASVGRTLHSLNLLIDGAALLRHHERESQLAPGDFVLIDGASASTLILLEPSHLLSLQVPGERFASTLPDPSFFCNRPFASDQGFARALREILETLWRQGEAQEAQGELLPQPNLKLLLDLFALASLSEHGSKRPAPKRGSRLVDIKAFIRGHLSDPTLCPQSVAEKFGISSRYLRKLFASEGDSFARYIQRCRLEVCAEQLSSACWRDTSITEICFRAGFNSSAHFTRCFKEHFGVTPKAYRRAGLRPAMRVSRPVPGATTRPCAPVRPHSR